MTSSAITFRASWNTLHLEISLRWSDSATYQRYTHDSVESGYASKPPTSFYTGRRFVTPQISIEGENGKYDRTQAVIVHMMQQKVTTKSRISSKWLLALGVASSNTSAESPRHLRNFATMLKADTVRF